MNAKTKRYCLFITVGLRKKVLSEGMSFNLRGIVNRVLNFL